MQLLAVNSLNEVPVEVAWVLCGVFGVIALALFIGWWRAFRFRRLMQDTPTCEVKGVFVGQVEVKGECVCPQPLTSYLAEIACAYYQYSIEEEWEREYTTTDSKGNVQHHRERGWSQVASGGDMVPFLLRDQSGEIRVEPAHATWDAKNVFSTTCGRGDPLYYGKGPSGAVGNSLHVRRFTEHAIPAGAQLYMLASARIRDDAAELELGYEKTDGTFFISVRKEEQITFWKGFAAWSFGIFGVLFGAGIAVACLVALRVELHPGWSAGGGALIFLMLLCLGFAVLVRNEVVSLRNRLLKSTSLVDVQLRRRADLIPNLVAVARAASVHERDVQELTARLRAEQEARAALLAVAERYPVLHADQNFTAVSDALIDTENRIALSRSFEIASRVALMRRLAEFPDGALARLLGAGSVPDVTPVAPTDTAAPPSAPVSPSSPSPG